MNNLDNYRTYGVEVEFISPLSQRELVEEINRNSRNHNSQSLADLQFDMPIVCISSYSNDDSSIWRIKTDGSVSGRGHGLELVTPVLKGEMDMLRLRKILAWLEEIGCTVNRTCGLHVHVGVSDWQVGQFKNLAKRYVKFETAIDSFMPRSRRSSQNHYCQSNAKHLADDIRYRSQFDTCDLPCSPCCVPLPLPTVTATTPCTTIAGMTFSIKHSSSSSSSSTAFFKIRLITRWV